MNRIIILSIIACGLLFSLPSAARGERLYDNKKPVHKEIPTKPNLYRISGVKLWYLIGNALTPGDNTLRLSVASDVVDQSIEVLLDRQIKVKLAKTAGGFAGEIDITDLAAGKHSLQLIANGNAILIPERFFYRSHPLYVLLTTDWDTSDSKNSVLERHEQLHAGHSGLRITHFFAPYTFTDPAVSKARRSYLVHWLKGLRNAYRDEIGLHIHPYCNFVNTVAGVSCRFKPSDTFAKGDVSGYTVLSSAYGEADYLRLLKASDVLFTAHGLGKPTSFRAGSWAADAGTLKALAADGFVADSSANNWLKLKEESEDDGNGVLYQWNRQHWNAINDLSQPYVPAEQNPTVTGTPHITILEVPDNASMVDYVTDDEMIGIFQVNWPGRPLPAPKTYVFGFHPVSYDRLFHARIEKTLNHIDQFLAVNGQGPVVYETLSDMARVFPTTSH